MEEKSRTKPEGPMPNIKVKLIPEGTIHEIPPAYINAIGDILVRRDDLPKPEWESRAKGTYEIIEKKGGF